MDGQNFNTEVQNSNQTNVLAIVSLVAGIVSIIGACCFTWLGIIAGIAGIICAVFANKQGKTGLAKAGMICSIVGLALCVILIIAALVLGVGLGLADMASY
ncbi:MAG: hypothetical protein J1E64_07625 [Acetatifactor sp.]|nr:hypothetical protein [Acetatifactor sp.]